MGAYTRKPRKMLSYPKTNPGPQGGSIGRAAKALAASEAATLQDTTHHELCDINDVNPDGIKKPCNCRFPHS